MESVCTAYAGVDGRIALEVRILVQTVVGPAERLDIIPPDGSGLLEYILSKCDAGAAPGNQAGVNRRDESPEVVGPCGGSGRGLVVDGSVDISQRAVELAHPVVDILLVDGTGGGLRLRHGDDWLKGG